MPKNCVEYGSIDYDIDNTDNTGNTYVERGIMCLMASLGITLVCTGLTLEGILMLGVAYYMKQYPLDVYDSDFESDFVSDFDSEDDSDFDSDFDSVDDSEDDSVDDSVDDSEDHAFKARINELAAQVTHLPCADLSGYNAEDYPDIQAPVTRKRLLNYLDTVLQGCDWIRTNEELGRVDPRIKLVVNREPDVDVKDNIQVLVCIKDVGWLGEPTANTMIVGVLHRQAELASFAEDIAEFKYMSDYEEE